MNRIQYLPVALVALLVAFAGVGMAQPGNESDDGNVTNGEDVGQDAPGDGDGDDGTAVVIWVLVIGAILIVAVIAIVAAAQNRERL